MGSSPLISTKQRLVGNGEFYYLHSIFILQDQDNKSKFACYLNNYSFKTKFHSELELARSEVERLVHTVIESGKARVEGNIQYVPYIRDMED